MTKFMELFIGIAIAVMIAALFVVTVSSADAKRAKKAPTEQKCTPYGDADAGPQMCGTVKK